MVAPNRNTLWAEIFVDELARAGLKSACIAPGSRSTPLTVAFASHPAITVHSLLDERGAAYFALGIALATGAPAALVCTSGTAAANFYPAIVEANSAQAPLLVLTTDRPHELRHSGANQTIDQVKLYGDHVRWFVDVALPETGAIVLRSLRTLAHRAFAATLGLPPGPVHLNFPFRKPLEPTSVPGDVPDSIPAARPAGQPFTRISLGKLMPAPAQVDSLAETITAARRGLIICGPRCPGGDFPAAVTRLAQASGYPVLADALSGLRFGPHVDALAGQLIAGYDTFLQPETVAHWSPPEVILRFGALPISMVLGRYIAAHGDSRHLQISDTGVWQDDAHTTSDFLWADPVAVCESLAERLGSQPADEPWLAQWCAADQITRQVIDAARQDGFFEGDILNEVTETIPQNAHLFVGNSLIVRHLDQFVPQNSKNIRVYANRGASGIDGVTATALGIAAATAQPLVLVTGDVSFYHDLNSLLALRRLGLSATLVVINNNGGGIFRRLPIANFDPPFTDLFLTQHDLNFAAAAQLFGTEYVCVESRPQFRRALSESVAASTAQIIEVTADSAHHEQVRRQIIAQVAGLMPNPASRPFSDS